jgi:cupin superfamily acireductone dioxygenase involved in methionine salvage
MDNIQIISDYEKSLIELVFGDNNITVIIPQDLIEKYSKEYFISHFDKLIEKYGGKYLDVISTSEKDKQYIKFYL